MIKNILLQIILSIVLLFNFSLCGMGFGKCKVQPSPSVVQNFNIERYMGKWYEQFRDASMLFQQGECDTADYSINEDGSVKVVNSELFFAL